MEHRFGRFGGFWYCPTHGTISDKGVELLQKTQETEREHFSSSSSDSLLFQIKHRTFDFGVMPTDLEEWIVDDEAAADYEEDHWMNVRPY